MKPFANQSFYLDLKMYPGEATLTKNLKFLGAIKGPFTFHVENSTPLALYKVEPVFSRCVSCVVTNRKNARNRQILKPFKVQTKPQNWSPLTPIPNTACHSPLFLNESSVDYMDSPPYADSPAAVPLCRGMAMVKKAISKKKDGTTDFFANCRRWNVKVIHLKDFLLKVEKIKKHFGVQFADEKKRTQNGERKLNPPFLKVYDINNGNTWYQEFPSSTFDNKLGDNVKELCNKFSIAQSLVPTKDVSNSFSKFNETVKLSTVFHYGNVKRKLFKQYVVASKKKKEPYCEICKVNYVHLDKHLQTNSHQIFMSDPMNYLKIKSIISSLPQKEDFLSRLNSSEINQIGNEVLLAKRNFFVNSTILEDKSYQNPSIQRKNIKNYFHSGISIQDNPSVRDSLKDPEAALLEVGECSTLNPRITTEVLEPAFDYTNKTNIAVNVTYGNLEDVKTDGWMDYDASSQDTTSPTIICESVPWDFQSIPNKSTFSYMDEVVSCDIKDSNFVRLCEDAVKAFNDIDSYLSSKKSQHVVDSKAPNILHCSESGDSSQNTTNVANPPLQIKYKNYKKYPSSDIKVSNFVRLCEDLVNSFNDIDSDLSSFGRSYYEYVVSEDFIDSSQYCDWGLSENSFFKNV